MTCAVPVLWVCGYVFQVDADRDNLPLGDYMWLVLPEEQQGPQHHNAPHGGAAAARGGGGDQQDEEDGDEAEEEDEESAAAAERSRCLLAGAVVERKTVRGEERERGTDRGWLGRWIGWAAWLQGDPPKHRHSWVFLEPPVGHTLISSPVHPQPPNPQPALS